MNKLISIETIIIGLFFCAMVSCKNGKESTPSHNPPGRKDLENLNIYLVQKDREIIQSYIERKNLNMAESKSGLWFLVVKQGEGDYIRENDKVIFDYKCSLLDGTLCYSSEVDGQKEIILEEADWKLVLKKG